MCVLLLVGHILQRIAPQYPFVHRDIDKAVQPAQAMVHVRRRIAQIFFQEELERVSELLRDVGKGDVLHASGLEELLQVKLCGLRLPVGGGGVYFLRAYFETFPFRLAALEQGLRDSRHSRYGVLQQFRADRSLLFEQAVVGPFQILAELRQPVVLTCRADASFLAVPILRAASDSRGDKDVLPVDGHPAEDGARAVRFDSFLVDVRQYLECAAHNGEYNGFYIK